MAIETVGIAGAGTMGTGIAIVAARAGFRTRIYDTRQGVVDNARQQAENFLRRSVERGKLSAERCARILENWSGTTRIEDLGDCDYIIESVFEDLRVKQLLFGQLNTLCRPHTLFASNTSTISITEIAAGSGRPDRFVGMHFCLPAQLMKLVELSPGLATSGDTWQRAWDFTGQLGQKPVKTK